MKILYEVLVPTIYGDSLKPISTAHHKAWDKVVQKITGGMTIMSPAKGRWTFEGRDYPERVIPVRVMCEEVYHHGFHEDFVDKSQINKIVQFTLEHYRQKAVMYYVLSNQVEIVYAKLPVEVKEHPGWVGQRGGMIRKGQCPI
jgi:hypothetical protein